MHTDIKPGMHWRRRKAWGRVEKEFGAPFWSVVQDFADMGYGKYAVARILGLNPSAFVKTVRECGQHIQWPEYRDMVVWKEHNPADEARAKAISEGRRRSGKGVFWVEVNGKRMTATDAANLAGVSTTTIMRRWKNGARGRALLAPPRGAPLITSKPKADHPWRSEWRAD